MKVVILRFPHLAEQIIQKLNDEGLAKSREVERVLHNFIDEKGYSWLRIINIPTTLVRGNTYYHLAAEHGQIDAFEMMLNENSNKNPLNYLAKTLLVAYNKGRMNIVSLLLKKSEELKIDLNIPDVFGYTGLVQSFQTPKMCHLWLIGSCQ